MVGDSVDSIERDTYVVEKGLISEAELCAQTAHAAPKPGMAAVAPTRTSAEALQAGDGPPATPASCRRFKPGDSVIARNINPAGHTRLPRYVRGTCGTVDRFLGVFTFPDTNALELGQCPQPCYAVRFEASELWGDQTSKRDSVRVDLWENYLEPA